MIAIRVLDDDRVIREIVTSSFPVTIGRAPSCTLVLSSLSVSRVHARIDHDNEGLAFFDESRNGVYVGLGRVASRVPLTSKMRFHVGDATIEIEPVLGDAATVELKTPLRVEERRRGALHHVLCALSVACATGLTMCLDTETWSPWNNNRAATLVSGVMGGAAGTVLVGLGLFVLYKALGRRLRLADVFHTMALIAWIFPIAAAVEYLLYYALSPSALGRITPWLYTLSMVVVTVAIAGIRRARSWRFVVGIAGLALAGLAALDWVQATTAQKNGEPAADFTVQAPLGSWTGPVVSLDDYWKRVSQATRDAEQKAAQVEAAQREE